LAAQAAAGVSICIAGAGLAVRIVAASFTLSWTHTVEKTRWQETWRVEGDRFVLAEARIEGSGAGMEPPPQARLEGGAYVWRPDASREAIVLRRHPLAGDWLLCAGGRCDSIGDWLGGDADPVILSPAAANGCGPAAPRRGGRQGGATAGLHPSARGRDPSRRVPRRR
jgi:hypothetical protein